MKAFVLTLLFVFAFTASWAGTEDRLALKTANVYVDPAVKNIKERTLPQYSGILQLFTHGRPGQLLVQGEWKNPEEIAEWLQQQFVLSNYEHINIYGCEFAKGNEGQDAIIYLEQKLQISISASTNITGKGGDWILETGKQYDVISIPGYQYSLQCPTTPSGSNVTTVNNTSCISGSPNGSFTFSTVTYTIGTHEFSIDGGATWQASNVFNNLGAASYSLRVKTISGGCFSTVFSASITNATTTPTTPAGTATAPTSCITPNGQISLNNYTNNNQFQFSIDGGTTWVTGSGTNPGGVVFSGLAAGTYNIIAKNIASGCISANSSNITLAVTALTTPAGTATAPTSCTTPNGQISLNTYTNNNQFQFSIDGGATWITGSGTNPGGVVFTGLAAGTYNIIAKNIASGCTSASSSNISVAAPTALTTPAGTGTAPTHCTNPNGQISLNTYTNNNQFQFSIDGGATWITGSGTNPGGVVFSGLAPGTYNIIAKNIASGCTSANSSNITLAIPASLTIPGGSATAPTSCISQNGQISLSSYTNNNQFEFTIDEGATWIVGSGATPGVVFTGLAPGTYKINARNIASGCISENSSNITVAAPTALTTPAGTATTPTSCISPNGQISLNTYTNNNQFQFSINGGATWITGSGTNPGGVVFSGLAAGTYNIIAKNIVSGCTSANSSNITVAAPTALTTPAGTATAPTSCISPNGQISLNTYTNNNQFQFSIDGGATWITGSGTNPGGVVFSGLAAGTYNIIAKNIVSGCTSANSSNITVAAPTALTTPAGTATAPTSCITPNGQISLNSYTNNNQFEFSINGGATWITGSGTNPGGVVFSGLAAGTYNIIAKNIVSGCTSANSSNITVAAPTALTAPAGTATAPTSCISPNGQISLNSYTNNNQFQFSIDGGANWITGSGTNPGGVVFTGLAAGTYNIIAKNIVSGCTSPNSSNITVAAPTALTAPAGTQTAATSCSSPNGQVSLNSYTNNNQFQFSIDGGATWITGSGTNPGGVVFSGLAPGTYNIIAKNILSGCTSANSSNITVGQPAVSTPTVTKTNSTSCSSPNGTITVTAPTPLTDFTFSINGGATWQASGNFVGLAAGSYTVLAKSNSTGCISSATAAQVVAAPTAPALPTITKVDQSSCSPANGKITITAPTPLNDFLFSIDNGVTFQSSNIFSNITAGSYNAVVKNIVTGCTSSSTAVSIAITTTTTAPTTSKTDKICTTNGTITFTNPTPASSFTFSIDGGVTYQSSNVFSNLNAGNYSVVVKSNSTSCPSVTLPITISDVSTSSDCADNDGDGIANRFDIDDDNDGVLDTVENNCKFGFYESFGSGTGSPNRANLATKGLPGSSTGYSYQGGTTGGIVDGQYSIANYLNSSAMGYWWTTNSITDPVNPGGNFMIINGTSSLSVYRSPNFTNWIPGVTYNYSFYALDAGTQGGNNPNLTLEIYDLSNNLIASKNTGSMAHDVFQWFKFSSSFVPAVTSGYFKIVNNAPAGTGNDFLIDEIVMYTDEIICDADNDGIPNDKDLDSDGDGCPDAVEAGVFKTSGGPAMENGSVKNGSGGTVTSTKVMTNAVVSGSYDSNGFANSVETGTESGKYNSTYTYSTAIDAGTQHPNCSMAVILPVYWLSVKAVLQNDDAKITWRVTEKDVDYYIVQRSVNGSNFTDIATVDAINNSSTLERTYNYFDSRVTSLNVDRVLYRIVSVDIDGKKEYSTIVGIRINKNNELIVYPVPATNEVTVQGTKEELSTIRLYNTIGQDMTSMISVVKSGETVSLVSVAKLPAGVYYLKTKTKASKIIKQ